MPILVSALPFVFVLIWSTGWIVAGFTARYADPIWFLYLRYMLAAAAVFLIACALRSPFPPDRRTVLHAMVSGVLLHALYLGGVWWAVKQGVPSGVSGIMAGLQPVMTAMLAPILLAERVSALRAAGVALGFVGVGLVLAPKLVGVGTDALEAIAIPLGVNFLAMVSVTLGTFYQKRFVSQGDLTTTTFWQYVGAALVTLPAVPLVGGFKADWTPTLIATMAWSVMALSVGGIFLFLYLVSRGEVSRATAYIFLVPPVAALMAFLFFGETLAPVQVAGMAVTAAGVFFATRKA